MQIRQIENKDEWEGFLLQCSDKSFLQSWNWGEFNDKSNAASAKASASQAKIWRFGIFSHDRIVAAAFAYKISARRGTFLFVPHGPVVLDEFDVKDNREILELLLLELKNIAKEEKASFIRLAPILQRGQDEASIFSDLGFRQAPTHMHPEVTWELDITPSEEEILRGMRKTTRYLIRQAEKNSDIGISISEDIEDLKLFWPVYAETAKRHHFVVFSENYLKNEFNSFCADGQVKIFLGKYKGQVVSAAIFIFWQGTCFYHHSGSLTKFNKIPVSYLLQWNAMKEAKKNGCTSYNFWGIAPGIETEQDAQKSRHPWAGLSLFKMGFGGYKKEYVKTQDYIISKKYWINYIIEAIRKIKRNL